MNLDDVKQTFCYYWLYITKFSLCQLLTKPTWASLSQHLKNPILKKKVDLCIVDLC